MSDQLGTMGEAELQRLLEWHRGGFRPHGGSRRLDAGDLMEGFLFQFIAQRAGGLAGRALVPPCVATLRAVADELVIGGYARGDAGLNLGLFALASVSLEAKMSLLAAAISEDGMRVLLAVAREQSQSAIAETRGPRDVFERFMAQGAITPSRLALELLMLIVANTGNDGIAAAARLASSPGMLSDVLAVLAESPPAGAGKPARSASLSYWACACLAEMALRLFPTAVGPATPAEAAVHAPDAPRDGAARFAPHMAAALLASPGALANALANAGCDDDMVAWWALHGL
jgi:hypothetical protein